MRSASTHSEPGGRRAHLDGRPAPQGMYDPRNEHDACGVGFVATLTGEASHALVDQALTVLRNLEHRGATGSEPDSGDGAGILVQIPDAFLRETVAAEFTLPAAGSYAVGIAFLPFGEEDRAKALDSIHRIAAEEGLEVLGRREVPVAPEMLGATARSTMPYFCQLFVADATGGRRGIELDRLAFVLRKRAERDAGVYFPSLSARTIVYKGMLTTGQLEPFFPDLSDRRFATAIALVHSRFSTNTFPSWPLAHPYRFVAHNGEINTVQGNRNWMRARESQLASEVFGSAGHGGGSPDLERIFPVCTPGASDSATFDEVLELLHLGGRSLPHSVLMMIPEAWENHESMDPDRRAFYQFHSTMMEPWDGPACVTFTDGTLVGAVLDRNGLRPGRYWVTDDGLVVLSSEVGVLDIAARPGRTQGPPPAGPDVPGRHRRAPDHRGRRDQVRAGRRAPVRGLAGSRADQLCTTLPEREHIVHTHASVTRRQQTFGYTEEELRVILAPMAKAGAEPIGSMGTDSPIAALSDRPRLLFDYFTQLFAQVTNPPLDAIREELVTSLISVIGPQGNLLEPAPASCRTVILPFPVIDNDELAKLIHINADGDLPGLSAATLSGLYRVAGGGEALAARLAEICAEADAAIEDGARIIVLSDRHSDAEHAPIPSLLLTSAVHHHLIRTKKRTQVGAARRGRRRTRGAPRRPARRLRRRGSQPVPGHGVGRGPGAGRHLPRRDRARGRHQEPHQGPGQGRAQGDVQDGHLHRRLLPRRAGLRGGRPRHHLRGHLLPRHRHQDRRRRRRRDRQRGRRPARQGVPGLRHLRGPPAPGDRRRVPVAPRGRAAPVRPGHRLPAPARHPRPPLRHLQEVHRAGRRAVRSG